MRIIAFYIAFVAVGDLAAYAIGRTVERWSEATALPLFLVCFFAVYWGAWRLAIKVTEPRST